MSEGIRNADENPKGGLDEKMVRKIDPQALPVIELLGLDHVSAAVVDSTAEVPVRYISLWEKRGWEVGKIGTIDIRFGHSHYTYPLHLSRSEWYN